MKLEARVADLEDELRMLKQAQKADKLSEKGGEKTPSGRPSSSSFLVKTKEKPKKRASERKIDEKVRLLPLSLVQDLKTS